MSHCYICKDLIIVGEVLSVISFPVKCTNDGGDYSFLGDFTKNEKQVHFSCLSQKFPDLVETLNGKPKGIKTISKPEAVMRNVPAPRLSLCKELAETLKG